MPLSKVIVGIVILALVYFFVRRKGSVPAQSPAARRLVKASPTTAYHAVSIKFASSACSAAKEFEGKRFLSSAAPRIPLPDCDEPNCKCRFVHHKDRRAGDDRRNPYKSSLTGETGTYRVERRHGPDRRQEPAAF